MLQQLTKWSVFLRHGVCLVKGFLVFYLPRARLFSHLVHGFGHESLQAITCMGNGN